MAHGDARERKWRGRWRLKWVASTLHTTSEHGVSRITTAEAHTSAASSLLDWRPCQLKWTRLFRRKTKSGLYACAITFETQSNTGFIKFRGSVKGTDYPLHPSVSASLPLACVTVCHHISTGLYFFHLQGQKRSFSKWRQNVLSKCLQLITLLLGVTTNKTRIFHFSNIELPILQLQISFAINLLKLTGCVHQQA